MLSNNTSWRKYNGVIDGRVLNNKHNYYVKLGVYDELYKINLKKYLKKNKHTDKYLSIDSTFIQNKYGTEKIGRNFYYKNKHGIKITPLVDSKGIPLKIDITEGNRHDAVIAPKLIDKLNMYQIDDKKDKIKGNNNKDGRQDDKKDNNKDNKKDNKKDNNKDSNNDNKKDNKRYTLANKGYDSNKNKNIKKDNKNDIKINNKKDKGCDSNNKDNKKDDKKDNKRYILADKGYDSNKIRTLIKQKNYTPIIAKRKYKNKNKSLKKYEIKIYKKRIIVENFFAWLKMFPKINKIYEKKIKSYNGLLLLAISIIVFKRC